MTKYKQLVFDNDFNINSEAVINYYRSFDDLIDESSQMSNCVRIYSERIVNGDCQIYFMRYKRSKNKSLVTIEVRNNKVVQARTKYNKDTTEEQSKVIKEFEKRLIGVNFN